MFDVIKSDEYERWFATLRDKTVIARINARIYRALHGNLGDWKALSGGVSEMRIDAGPGYRLYFTRRGTAIIILLCGGDKHTQDADIKRAAMIAKRWEG
ncbi:MAG: type II toxin-antitoxin system RelE/ParE family toxin [Desulfobulbus sp.]|nr:type II toxin-antitoxin system RelE/ParE family toxin [Desulfobulbus sp.]